jgi:hypothetical protein
LLLSPKFEKIQTERSDDMVVAERELTRPGQVPDPDGPREFVPGFTYRFRTPGDNRFRGIGEMVGSYSDLVGDRVVGFLRLERPGGRVVDVQETHVGPVVPPKIPIIR